MLIQDLNYLETTANEIEGAAGATAIAAGLAAAFGDDLAASEVLAFTEAISAPNFNLAVSEVLSASAAV